MSDILFDAETSNRRVLPSLNAAFGARMDMVFVVGGKRVSVREIGRTPQQCPASLAGCTDLAGHWPPQVTLAVGWGDGSTELTIGPDTSADGENVALVVRHGRKQVYLLQIGWRLRKPDKPSMGYLVGELQRKARTPSAEAAEVCEAAGLVPTIANGCLFILGTFDLDGTIRPSPREFLRSVLLFSLITQKIRNLGSPGVGWTGSPLW